jgi:hypothetical protein
MNRYYENMYNPSNVNKYAQQYNPWIWDAIQGKNGTGGTQFQTDIYNIMQGKDISPYLLNNPMNQLNQGANQNLARFQSMVGRNNSGGGLANAYALANLGGRNVAMANLMNQYGQWREAQRRSDINWGLGQVGQSQDRGQATADRIAQSHTFEKNFWQKLGISAAGYGGTASPLNAQNGQMAYRGNGTTDSWGNIPSTQNSNSGYQDPYQYPYGASNGQYTPNPGYQGGSSNPYPATTSTVQSGNAGWYNNPSYVNQQLGYR